MADETKQANKIGATLGAARDVAAPSASAAEPQLPPTPTTIAAKAKDLEVLRNAVVDAARAAFERRERATAIMRCRS